MQFPVRQIRLRHACVILVKMVKSPWFSTFHAVHAPRIRLVCLPHAGGGISVFHHWKKEVPSDIELCAVQLPGRDSRYHEPLDTDLLHIVGELAKALLLAPPTPLLVIFGHSMGAVMAFELAHTLARGHRRPDLLIVSGRAAPHLHRAPTEHLHRLSNAAFIDKLQLRYGGIPDALLADAELMKIYLPILRADLQAVETYRYAAWPADSWPLMAYGGTEDQGVGRMELNEWQQHTTGSFGMSMLPVSHFYYQTHRAAFLQRLLEDVHKWCPTPR